MTDKTFFIVNPKAGGGKAARLWPDFAKKLTDLPVDWQYTTAKGSAVAQVRQALADGYQRIIAVGGDGTVNEALNGFVDLSGAPPPGAVFGFWPIGTGGDLARYVYHDNKCDADNLRDLLLNGQVFPADLAQIEFWLKGKADLRFYLNGGDIGLGADTCRRVNQGSKSVGGFLSFMKAALGAIWQYRYQPMELTVDGQHLDGEYLLIFCGNGRYTGGGMLLCPGASLTNGLLDIVLADRMSRGRVFRFFGRVYSGTHLSCPGVKELKASRMSVKLKEPLYLQTDGEVFFADSACFSINEHKLPLLVPKIFLTGETAGSILTK